MKVKNKYMFRLILRLRWKWMNGYKAEHIGVMIDKMKMNPRSCTSPRLA